VSCQARRDLERRLRDATDEFSACERQWWEGYLENREFGLAFELVVAFADAGSAGPTVWTILSDVVDLMGIGPDHDPHGAFVARVVDRVSETER